MPEEKNDLENLRHITSDVDFGMEIDNIAELEEKPKVDPNANKTQEDANAADPNKKKEVVPSISISSNKPRNGDEAGDDIDDIGKKDTLDNRQTEEDVNNDAKFNVLLKTLGEKAKEKNILDFSADEFEKAEDKDQYFNDKLTSTIDTRAKEKFEQEIAAYKAENLPEEINELIELHKKGVPLYAILESDQTIASIEGITVKEIEDDISLQKTLVSEALAAQGYAKDKIEAKVKRYEDLGALKDESLEAKDVLLAFEKERKQTTIRQESERKQNSIRQRDIKIAEITSTINTREEILPGFKLTPEDRKTLIEGITKMSHYDKQGKQINALQKARIDDPLHDLKLAYFTLVLKGDVSKIKTKTESAVTKRLKDALDTQDRMGSNQHDTTERTQSNGKGYDRNALREALKVIR